MNPALTYIVYGLVALVAIGAAWALGWYFLRGSGGSGGGGGGGGGGGNGSNSAPSLKPACVSLEPYTSQIAEWVRVGFPGSSITAPKPTLDQAQQYKCENELGQKFYPNVTIYNRMVASPCGCSCCEPIPSQL